MRQLHNRQHLPGVGSGGKTSKVHTQAQQCRQPATPTVQPQPLSLSQLIFRNLAEMALMSPQTMHYAKRVSMRKSASVTKQASIPKLPCIALHCAALFFPSALSLCPPYPASAPSCCPFVLPCPALPLCPSPPRPAVASSQLGLQFLIQLGEVGELRGMAHSSRVVACG